MHGVAFDPLTSREAGEHIVRGFDLGSGGVVVTPNLDVLRLVCDDPQARCFVERAELVLADGMPIVWASRLRGSPLPERVAGSSLFPHLIERAATEGIPVFLLGGAEGSAQAAAERLAGQHPRLRLGWHCPPFGFEHRADELELAVAAVADFGRCLCLVGLPFLKTVGIVTKLVAVEPATWYLGGGATIDFLAGRVPRAPEVMQRAGMEWLFRLAVEPRRLAGRYLWHDVPFGARLLTRAGADGVRARGRARPTGIRPLGRRA